jgi:hypothetical protein
VRREWDVVALCRRHLEALPGVRKAIVRTPVRSTDLPRPDLSLVLDTDVGKFAYAGAVKRRLTATGVDHWLLLIVPRVRRGADKSKPILLADYVSPALGQRLREAGVDYVDAAGNLSIHRARKLYMFKEGARPPRLGEPKPRRLFMPSGLQVLFVLLIDPAATRIPYRELAEHSGVALGSVAAIMDELRRSGYLVQRRDGWGLVRRRELLDRWIAGYSERLRPKLTLGRFHAAEREPTRTLERLREVLRQKRLDYALTGGFAADELTHHYRGESLAVFVSEWPRGLLQQLRWLPSAEGSLSVFRQFGPSVVWPASSGEHPLAHPLLVYAELLHGGTERERETARMIFEQHLERLTADSAD